MPPTAVHGLIGWIIGKTTAKITHVEKHEADMITGAVLGSVVPDLDLIFLSMPIALYSLLVTGSVDWESASVVHRTITHSILTIMIILLLSRWLIARRRDLALTFHSRGGQRFAMNIPFVLLGMSIGMFFHSLADLFYIGDIALFWPLLANRYSVVNVPLSDVDISTQLMFAIVDSAPEPFWWLLFIWWTHQRYHNISTTERRWLALAIGYLAYITAFFIMALLNPPDLTELLLTAFLAGAIWMYLLTTVVVWQYKELFYLSGSNRQAPSSS